MPSALDDWIWMLGSCSWPLCWGAMLQGCWGVQVCLRQALRWLLRVLRWLLQLCTHYGEVLEHAVEPDKALHDIAV